MKELTGIIFLVSYRISHFNFVFSDLNIMRMFLPLLSDLDFQTLNLTFFSVRMLVYEYVDNGNLFQWLHENPEKVSPLTWSIRVKIIRGIAKG